LEVHGATIPILRKSTTWALIQATTSVLVAEKRSVDESEKISKLTEKR
jgi:hypothetical protein